jgi:hypothetical protein
MAYSSIILIGSDGWDLERLQLAANDDISIPLPQASVYKLVGQNRHVSMGVGQLLENTEY